MRRVLVVDADPYRRVFVVQLLAELGLRVLMAGTEAEARGIIDSLGARVGGVVVSGRFGELSGLELAAELAAAPGERRVLLVTEAADPARAVPPGIVALAKPLTRDKVAAALRD